MPVNTIYNDSDVVYGARDLTINGVVYATDDFSLDHEVTEIVRTKKNERPSGQVAIKGRITGSATLQLATSSTALPEMGMTFTVTEGTFIVRKVGRTETKGGETKVPIEFVEKLGTVVVTTE